MCVKLYKDYYLSEYGTIIHTDNVIPATDIRIYSQPILVGIMQGVDKDNYEMVGEYLRLRDIVYVLAWLGAGKQFENDYHMCLYMDIAYGILSDFLSVLESNLGYTGVRSIYDSFVYPDSYGYRECMPCLKLSITRGNFKQNFELLITELSNICKDTPKCLSVFNYNDRGYRLSLEFTILSNMVHILDALALVCLDRIKHFNISYGKHVRMVKNPRSFDKLLYKGFVEGYGLNYK